MSRVKSVLLMHWQYKGVWAVVPVLVLFSSFMVNLILAHAIRTEFTTGGVASIAFALLIVAIVAASQTYPFALGLGVRRRDYVIGTVMTGLALSAGTALLLTMMSVIESRQTGVWGGLLHFFDLPPLQHLGPFGLLVAYLVTSSIMCMAGLLMYAVFARYGRMGMAILFVGGPFVGGLLTYLSFEFQWWEPLAASFDPANLMSIVLWGIPVVVGQVLLMFGLLRRATI